MRRLVISIVLALLVLPAGAELHATSAPRPNSESPAVIQASQPPGTLGFYRFPTLHGDTIVFAAEGDLWRISTQGGLAQRLTTHPAEETDPAISPDGETLAFTARYEGPAELYTMPMTGGLPIRLTYEADSSIATTWTPAGELVYTTTHYSTLPQRQLVSIDVASDTRTRIPLETATEAAFDDTGTKLFFVRPAFHNNVTRRYTGGTARRVWKFAEGSAEAVNLTPDYVGESHSPMWWGGRVYFITDRDGTMNIWSMDENGDDLQQHTEHSGWDIKNPAVHEGRIVALRHRQRTDGARSHHPGIRPRPDARAVGAEPDAVSHLGAPPPRWREYRADRPWAGLRGTGRIGPPGARFTCSGRSLSRRRLHAGRRGSAGAH